MLQLVKKSDSEQLAGKMAAEAAVKIEVEDPLEDEHGSLSKRRKSSALGGFALSASQYNPLDEPRPLGLRLRKSPSLLELLQMKLSQSSSHKVGIQSRDKKQPTSSAAGDKLKASNFPASVLRIGTWEYKSRYEGELVAKCYFAKHKLVWEVLDGSLKNKIEIQWSDIMALKATYQDEGPETLDVVLARQPLFFRETNPQPRKHTLWQATSDFSGGQASVHKRHYLECAPGLLGRHIEKLTQCDPRLHFLSQQGEIILDSLYFEPRISGYDDRTEDSNEHDLSREGSTSLLSLNEVGSSSGARSPSPRNDQDALSHHSESHCHETTSTCSAIESESLEDMKLCLFSDIQNLANSDDKSLMSMVDSLCCLLQKDENNSDEEPNIEAASSMSRKDSLNDLLANLPRIASLPQFLFNISEDL